MALQRRREDESLSAITDEFIARLVGLDAPIRERGRAIHMDSDDQSSARPGACHVHGSQTHARGGRSWGAFLLFSLDMRTVRQAMGGRVCRMHAPPFTASRDSSFLLSCHAGRQRQPAAARRHADSAEE